MILAGDLSSLGGLMMSSVAGDRTHAPTYLPAGWVLAQDLSDDGRFAFGVAGRRVLYHREADSSAVTYPLEVYLSPPTNRPLAATEQRSGESVDLGLSGVSAVYHDGWWAQGPGEDAVSVGSVTTHWSHTVHSLTMRSRSGAAAVRVSRRHGLSLDALKDIARSMYT